MPALDITLAGWNDGVALTVRYGNRKLTKELARAAPDTLRYRVAMKRALAGLLAACTVASTAQGADTPVPFKLGTFERNGRRFVGGGQGLARHRHCLC